MCHCRLYWVHENRPHHDITWMEMVWATACCARGWRLFYTCLGQHICAVWKSSIDHCTATCQFNAVFCQWRYALMQSISKGRTSPSSMCISMLRCYITLSLNRSSLQKQRMCVVHQSMLWRMQLERGRSLHTAFAIINVTASPCAAASPSYVSHCMFRTN